MCGNDSDKYSACSCSAGSPPLVRERLFSSYSFKINIRITPACAGTTLEVFIGKAVDQDHPRLCGNDPTGEVADAMFEGSPPLVRERLFLLHFLLRTLRITPACAGTTPFVSEQLRITQDHPRLCGNDIHCSCRFFCNLGSPPLVRERPTAYARQTPCSGITPACAGTTFVGGRRHFFRQDHPRLCGNDAVQGDTGRVLEGSPPLVRERLLVCSFFPPPFGITPACAGTTQVEQKRSILPWDHPRLCGNDELNQTPVDAYMGSPPLVRERLARRRTNPFHLRITPACAGTTCRPILLTGSG